jgi:hypothetical protein
MASIADASMLNTQAFAATAVVGYIMKSRPKGEVRAGVRYAAHACYRFLLSETATVR